MTNRLILGIETSCDETSAAVVKEDRTILSNLILSQIKDHRPYGGIVPEIAARSHLDALDNLIRGALEKANVTWREISGIAATAGPGLIGGLTVGVMTGKAIALAHNLPFLAINHLEGHALTVRLTHNIEFPYLLLLVSGGHTQLLIVEGVGKYKRLGTTIDDAVGEAFDKVAKLLGLGYPGGPMIEKEALKTINPDRFHLPRPMKGRPDCHFSFSGLKTAVRQKLLDPMKSQDVCDMAAAFQQAVTESLVDRCYQGMKQFKMLYPSAKNFVVAGGVAANQAIREGLASLSDNMGFNFVAPLPSLCGDNAAMIAWAGVERLRLGLTDSLDFAPRPRWPLDPDATPVHGAGVKA